MKSWLIFKHAVRQLTGNWRAVTQISLPPIIISFTLDAFLYKNYLFLSINDLAKAHFSIVASFYTGNTQQSYAAFLVKALLSLSVAVAWHRYILLNENPSAVPKFHFVRMLVYTLKSLMIAVPVSLFIAAMLLPYYFFAAAENTPSGRLSFIISVALLLILPIILLSALRLSIILPGAALGANTPLREIWSKTSGQTGIFVGLGVLIVLSILLLQDVKFLFRGLPLIMMLALETFVVFLRTLVILSILTTLYGHYIEKRPLVS